MQRLKIGLMFFLFCFALSVRSASSPEMMLQHSADQVLSVLKTNQSKLKDNPSIIYGAVENYLLPHVDVTGMSRSVLGREAWMKATDKEKRAFSQAFTKLVIRTYSAPLAKYNGETVRFHPIRGGQQGRFMRIESEIIRPAGPSIPVNYSLVSKNGDWKVYDLSVEGVSLLQSFHTQFAQALRNQTLSELTAQMERNQLRKTTS